jgi:hypothetical protein
MASLDTALDAAGSSLETAGAPKLFHTAIFGSSVARHFTSSDNPWIGLILPDYVLRVMFWDLVGGGVERATGREGAQQMTLGAVTLLTTATTAADVFQLVTGNARTVTVEETRPGGTYVPSYVVKEVA